MMLAVTICVPCGSKQLNASIFARGAMMFDLVVVYGSKWRTGSEESCVRLPYCHACKL